MISRLAHFAANFFASLAAMTLAFPALALTQDELITQCKEAARAPVVACMAKAGARLDLCIASVGRPFVYACVVRLEQQQAARVPPPLPPKDEAASATKNEKSVRNAFVAPPRTIADITAILDSEKPDDAKIGKLKEAADIKPPTNVSSEKLAEFYFNRATARGLLSRNKEALEDAQQGLALRKGTVDYFLTNSLRHNIALQYSALGDQAGALAELETIVRGEPDPSPARLSDPRHAGSCAIVGFHGQRERSQHLLATRPSDGSGGSRKSSSSVARDLCYLR